MDGIFSTLVLVIAVSILVLMYRNYTKLSRNGIPGAIPLPLIGNLHQTYKRGSMDKIWEKKYGQIYGYYQGYHPHVTVTDTELLKKIFVKNFSNFTNRPNDFGNLPSLLANSLFFMRGKTWKRTRNIITPTFSSGKLKQMVPIINKYAAILTDNLLEQAGKSVVVRKYFGQFTMDTITGTAFGLDINSQKDPNNSFMRHMTGIFSPSRIGMLGYMMAALIPGTGKILYNLGLTIFPKESVAFFEDTGKMLIEDRRKTKQVFNDFMYLLLHAEAGKDEQVENGHKMDSRTDNGKDQRRDLLLSDDEVNGQAFVFFLAGYETTSSFLRFAAYVLATKPEFDKKLCDEINKHIGMDDPTYENIAPLKYMDQFVYEVLRFYPPVPRLARDTEDDIEMDGKTIPKGTTVIVPVFSIHHNEDNYPDPERFNPDRFPPGKTVSPDSTTFLPFGAGPRYCIGTRLALIEVKVALVHMLRKLKFVKSSRTQERLELTQTDVLRPTQPIEVLIEKR